MLATASGVNIQTQSIHDVLPHTFEIMYRFRDLEPQDDYMLAKRTMVLFFGPWQSHQGVAFVNNRFEVTSRNKDWHATIGFNGFRMGEVIMSNGCLAAIRARTRREPLPPYSPLQNASDYLFQMQEEGQGR